MQRSLTCSDAYDAATMRYNLIAGKTMPTLILPQSSDTMQCVVSDFAVRKKQRRCLVMRLKIHTRT